MYCDGTTGTSKTSSVLTVAIADDLDQKVYNEDYQKKACYKAMKEGKLRMCLPFIGVLIPFAGTAFRPAPYFGRCRSNGSPASAKRAGR